ncbi:MAG: pyruvate, phosphate dikinase [Pseudomonadota bacterium]
MTKWVMSFGGDHTEGRAGLRDLLGGKGANLAEMANIGLPVPPGFTITTEVCTHYYAHDRNYPTELEAQVKEAVGKVEATVGERLGDHDKPLLMSVRSGAPISMPGMMDTVLNLGLNDETVEGLIAMSGDPRFAYDSYRRLIQIYSDVVLSIDHYLFEEKLEDLKQQRGARFDTDLDADDLMELVQTYKNLVVEQSGKPFPQDVWEQLWGGIGAVFSSWMVPRAQTYRRLNKLSETMGTAVNAQAMVYGNMGDDCATGVAFTRSPSTGEKAYYGEFLINAQGEVVVAGIRTPQPLTQAMAAENNDSTTTMEAYQPEAFRELCAIFDRLEQHYREMQDVEFTVQKGTLYILQTRTGKRTANASLKIAVDMAEEGLISREEAIQRIDPAQLDQLLHPQLDPEAETKVIAHGLPASPGAVYGEVVFSADDAEKLAGEGRKTILVRIETSPDDIHGMHAAEGILTSRGGMTSHAAVVARGMGKPCICGAGDIAIDYEDQQFRCGGIAIKAGDFITLDGARGYVIEGQVATIDPELSGDFSTLMSWADSVRRLKVRANAETPIDTSTAIKFGAEGVGLCRTEHMFFEDQRIIAVREMILAQDAEGRHAALAKVLPMQRKDFHEIFEIMAGRPVTIRLLDPPLHEFLPHEIGEMDELAASLGITSRQVKRRVNELREANPMLGLRGCRVGVLYPEIYEMQTRAIFEAAAELEQSSGKHVIPEVMVPLVMGKRELELIRKRIDEIAAKVTEESGIMLNYLVGTMIEVPRAAICAGEIAEVASFFSFGTNDLTQMGMGLSRDDAGRFLDVYIEHKIFDFDPFQSLDKKGVGDLIRIAVERGRAAEPDIKLGICGEHGGDPASIAFCEELGLDYVSCSPYRVPIARLVAA